MFYFTSKQSPRTHQITLEELIFDKPVVEYSNDPTATRTYAMERIPNRLNSITPNVLQLRNELAEFNKKYKELSERNRKSLYSEFHIPKRSGGLRTIDAPHEELKEALYELKTILEWNMNFTTYHTAAFAYMKGRSTIKCVKKHQQNESKWFLKLDLSNFFGSTTIDFLMKMFLMQYPFCLLYRMRDGEEQLRTALELAFLNGGLPQGTPLSPLVTNIMMIPIDHRISNELRNFDDKHLVYTRYADDFIISSRVDFDFRKVEEFVKQTLAEFSAPFTVNEKKTRYGSSSGRNFNLGIMLNKDNEMTIGRQAKREFEGMLQNYAACKLSNKPWDRQDVQVLAGKISYYKMVERETIEKIIDHFSQKMGVKITDAIACDLKVV